MLVAISYLKLITLYLLPGSDKGDPHQIKANQAKKEKWLPVLSLAQGYLKKVQEGCFKGVSKKFQGSFECFQKCQGHFKEV